MKIQPVFPALAAIVLSAALTTGCSTIQVESDYDRQVDFSKYTTYRWIPHVKGTEDNPLMRDPLIESHVRSAVDAELAGKGFRKIDEGHPDFLVAWYFTSRNRVDVTHYYGYWHPYTDVYRYREGTLILDMVDRADKELIWRGWATGVLEERGKLNDQIKYSVRKLLDRFPPDKSRERSSW